MAAQEIRVPDIGDFTDVPIIEILVAAGDTVLRARRHHREDEEHDHSTHREPP